MKLIISGSYVDRLIRQQTTIIPPPQNGALCLEVSSTQRRQVPITPPPPRTCQNTPKNGLQRPGSGQPGSYWGPGSGVRGPGSGVRGPGSGVRGLQDLSEIIKNMLLINPDYHTRKISPENYLQFGHAPLNSFPTPVIGRK
jgi:hypothetical protein